VDGGAFAKGTSAITIVLYAALEKPVVIAVYGLKAGFLDDAFQIQAGLLGNLPHVHFFQLGNICMIPCHKYSPPIVKLRRPPPCLQYSTSVLYLQENIAKKCGEIVI